jgi:hypothetical protein
MKSKGFSPDQNQSPAWILFSPHTEALKLILRCHFLKASTWNPIYERAP